MAVRAMGGGHLAYFVFFAVGCLFYTSGVGAGGGGGGRHALERRTVGGWGFWTGRRGLREGGGGG